MKLISKTILILFLLLPPAIFADILLNETFSSSSLPIGWASGPIQGAESWLIRNLPVFGSVSGGNYAVFDDNILGAGTNPNESALRTASIDCSKVGLAQLFHQLKVDYS